MFNFYCTALPRHSFLHNLVDFLEQSQRGPQRGQRITTSLQRLQSLTRPPTQYEQIERIKTVSLLRTSPTPRNYRHHPAALRDQGSRETLQRSRQAQKRVEQMRRVYGIGGATPSSPEGKDSLNSGRINEAGEREGEGETGFDEINDIEREADELYQWTQELSFDDIG